MQRTSASAGASMFISKATAQMVQTLRIEHRSPATDTKKQVPPISLSSPQIQASVLPPHRQTASIHQPNGT